MISYFYTESNNLSYGAAFVWGLVYVVYRNWVSQCLEVKAKGLSESVVYIKASRSAVYKAFIGKGSVRISSLESDREVERISAPEVRNTVSRLFQISKGFKGLIIGCCEQSLQ